MANTINLAKLYLDNLQKIWKRDSISAVLENGGLVRSIAGANANEVSLPVLSLDGLGDYSKSSGYPSGDATLTWVTKTLTQDRGKKFVLDTMDDFESMGVAGANLLAEFQRAKVVPEVDAYRFAKIGQGAYSGHRAYGTINSNAGALSAFETAMQTLDNAEVPTENRILFCTPAFLGYLKGAVGTNRFYMSDDVNIGRKIEMIDGVKVVSVPTTRFYLGWQKNTAGGYINEGSQYNFILLHKDAVLPVVKHNPIKVFNPEVNQSADGYVFNFRIYHDCFVMPNKEKGIYIHTVESYTPETVDTPVIAVTGDGTATVKFTATTPTTGANLYYTTDGTDPTASSSAYSTEVSITDATIPSTEYSTKTIKVVGIKSGMLTSEITSKTVKVKGSQA